MTDREQSTNSFRTVALCFVLPYALGVASALIFLKYLPGESASRGAPETPPALSPDAATSAASSSRFGDAAGPSEVPSSDAPAVAPVPVPLGGTATVTMSGCTEATVTSGSMTMTLRVIDADWGPDDTLVSNIAHTFTVPAGQIFGGLVTFPARTATITNQGGTIVGPAGSSGEGTPGDPAEIAFEIELPWWPNVQSSSTSVTAVQP